MVSQTIQCTPFDIVLFFLVSKVILWQNCVISWPYQCALLVQITVLTHFSHYIHFIDDFFQNQKSSDINSQTNNCPYNPNITDLRYTVIFFVLRKKS